MQAEKEAKESGHTRHFLGVRTSHPFITLYLPYPLFLTQKNSLARRDVSFSSGRAGEERGRGDDNRRSCACGSCDGPRHVAHVQVQRELKKKKREGISRFEMGERAQPARGGADHEYFQPG